MRHPSLQDFFTAPLGRIFALLNGAGLAGDQPRARDKTAQRWAFKG